MKYIDETPTLEVSQLIFNWQNSSVLSYSKRTQSIFNRQHPSTLFKCCVFLDPFVSFSTCNCLFEELLSLLSMTPDVYLFSYSGKLWWTSDVLDILLYRWSVSMVIWPASNLIVFKCLVVCNRIAAQHTLQHTTQLLSKTSGMSSLFYCECNSLIYKISPFFSQNLNFRLK